MRARLPTSGARWPGRGGRGPVGVGVGVGGQGEFEERRQRGGGGVAETCGVGTAESGRETRRVGIYFRAGVDLQRMLKCCGRDLEGMEKIRVNLGYVRVEEND